MSKKKRKLKQKSLSLKKSNLFCGFPLIERNINQLWRWDNLQNIKNL